MSWIYLIFAGLLEVVWAYSMKQSEGFKHFTPSLITLVAMIGSFGLLALAMRTLPLGTAYTIWTGIGAIGAFLIGILFLGEPISFTRLMAAFLILAGLIIMKLSSSH
ncbi:QacE family quaternary ammonium compound efflux SMR transporter (plasmid) [Runella rosea]|uniref:Guanidinium exporter n=1 Tax=Runella rosea TaxID=2259595 RepID=A0A344TTJ8_9BACT|nr:multidrug efflux SMR transporter [Runella rosea]AXE21969.1 QacE family quaternary ammonium compound efflux SMR transporter [Runella rosea]